MTNFGEVAVGGDEGRVPVQPRNYLRPCLLLLLEEAPTYGYELRHKLAPLSAGNFDPGTVYRTLNTMEDDGLVRSTWERSAEGPRRRRYEISESGSEVLDLLARELCGLRTMVNDFIARYESHHLESAADVRETHLAAVVPVPDGTTAARVTHDELAAAGRATNGHRPAQAVPPQPDDVLSI